MAKKPNLDNPFARTEGNQPAANNEDLDKGKILSSGVGLKEGELAAIDALAEEWGVKRNSLLRLAIRLFIIGVRSGTIRLTEYLEEEPRPKRRAVMPK